jgi:hypothetical protein
LNSACISADHGSFCIACCRYPLDDLGPSGIVVGGSNTGESFAVRHTSSFSGSAASDIALGSQGSDGKTSQLRVLKKRRSFSHLQTALCMTGILHLPTGYIAVKADVLGLQRDQFCDPFFFQLNSSNDQLSLNAW